MVELPSDEVLLAGAAVTAVSAVLFGPRLVRLIRRNAKFVPQIGADDNLIKKQLFFREWERENARRAAAGERQVGNIEQMWRFGKRSHAKGVKNESIRTKKEIATDIRRKQLLLGDTRTPTARLVGSNNKAELAGKLGGLTKRVNQQTIRPRLLGIF